MAKQKRAGLYVRVSTDAQTVENQIRELSQVAERRGWHVVEVYKDAGISGAKGRDQRPGLDAMLKETGRRKFDIVMAWAIDRLGRSLIDLLRTIQDLEAVGRGQRRRWSPKLRPASRALDPAERHPLLGVRPPCVQRPRSSFAAARRAAGLPAGLLGAVRLPGHLPVGTVSTRYGVVACGRGTRSGGDSEQAPGRPLSIRRVPGLAQDQNLGQGALSRTTFVGSTGLSISLASV